MKHSAQKKITSNMIMVRLNTTVIK
ncbi:uncharacterized protein METZ01_LOCUS388025 [marine metagenome]|uniref:Uncharacterized protein n=1 Tax=marine metagenome TaxID=408172 RepID=A0A382UNB9_9ZZZZ